MIDGWDRGEQIELRQYIGVRGYYFIRVWGIFRDVEEGSSKYIAMYLLFYCYRDLHLSIPKDGLTFSGTEKFVKICLIIACLEEKKNKNNEH